MIVRLLSLSILILASACTPELRQKISKPCPLPPPPPACFSDAYSTVAFDTSAVINGWRWKISRVLGAESSSNEWGLVRTEKNFLLIKGESAARAEHHPVRLRNVNSLDMGWPAGLSERGFVTRVSEVDITGDASIYEASVLNSQLVIGKPVSKRINAKVFWDGHATVSGDGRFMVFASDRKGTLGGTDLWYTTLKNDEWQEPKRLANNVNTACDELCPQFALNDSVLLFSSAGHSTAGGYDVFSSDVLFVGDSLVIRGVNNMGLPVNTPHDELFPQMTDRHTIYYSSNQPKASRTRVSDFDLFVLHRTPVKERSKEKTEPPPPPEPNTPTVVVTTPEIPPLKPVEQKGTIQGRVVNSETQLPVVDAEVTAKDNVTKVVLSKTNTDTGGRYSMDVPVDTPVEIVAQSPELFYDNVVVTVPADKRNDTVVVKQPLQLPVTFYLRINFPTAVFDDPYEYTLDSLGEDTRQTWQQALDQLVDNVKLSGKKLRRLVLIGHTDDVSTDASNMKLGKQRVDFVMQQLIHRGIEEKLLEGRSAGERLLPERRQGELIDVWRKRARRVELVKVMQ